MTQSSDRRRAELAVIEAARQFPPHAEMDSDFPHMRPFPTGLLLDLVRAVLALDALPLVEPTKGRAGGPLVTSQNAAKMVSTTSDNARILRALMRHRLGMTVEELCAHLNRKHQSISARVHELWRAGWLRVDPGHTRITTSGREATVWLVTDEAWWKLSKVGRSG